MEFVLSWRERRGAEASHRPQEEETDHADHPKGLEERHPRTCATPRAPPPGSRPTRRDQAAVPTVGPLSRRWSLAAPAVPRTPWSKCWRALRQGLAQP